MSIFSRHEGTVSAAGGVSVMRSWAWAGWPLAALLPAIGYFLAPTDDGGVAVRAVLYCSVTLGSAVVLVVGLRLHRPQLRSVWWSLAGGQFVYVGADILYFVAVSAGDASYPLPANILYLAQYLFVGAALIRLTRHRSPERNTAAVIDTSIVAVGAAVLWWAFLIRPVATAPDISLADRIAATAYPVMDLCVLTVAIRLVLGGRVQQFTYRLLLAFLTLMLVADTAYGLQTLNGVFNDGGWTDALWLASYVALGAAALHPSMRHLSDPVENRSGANPYRLVLLGVATSVAPAVLLVDNVRGVAHSDPLVIAASAALFLLVLVRMAGLLADQRRLATTDSLTGLWTRRFLADSLHRETQRAQRNGTMTALLLIDIDHFKRINDTYGHPAGDQVLCEVARRLRDTCRVSDVVARFGGEEFAVLLVGIDTPSLEILAERIRARVADSPMVIDGNIAVRTTVSIGGAGSIVGTNSSDQIVSTADAALYAAKRSGRNRFVVNDPSVSRNLPVPAEAAEAAVGAAAAFLEADIQRWAAVIGDTLRQRPDDTEVASSTVVGVCAAWAIMRTPHPDRPELSAHQARVELLRCRGVQFHARVVDEFLALQAAGIVGTTAVPVHGL